MELWFKFGYKRCRDDKMRSNSCRVLLLVCAGSLASVPTSSTWQALYSASSLPQTPWVSPMVSIDLQRTMTPTRLPGVTLTLPVLKRPWTLPVLKGPAPKVSQKVHSTPDKIQCFLTTPNRIRHPMMTIPNRKTHPILTILGSTQIGKSILYRQTLNRKHDPINPVYYK